MYQYKHIHTFASFLDAPVYPIDLYVYSCANILLEFSQLHSMFRYLLWKIIPVVLPKQSCLVPQKSNYEFGWGNIEFIIILWGIIISLVLSLVTLRQSSFYLKFHLYMDDVSVQVASRLQERCEIFCWLFHQLPCGHGSMLCFFHFSAHCLGFNLGANATALSSSLMTHLLLSLGQMRHPSSVDSDSEDLSITPSSAAVFTSMCFQL